MIFALGFLLNGACGTASKPVIDQNLSESDDYDLLFQGMPAFKSDGFDFPVGKPNAKGYYNAQGFGGESAHLGDDWNGTGGGDSDLGFPVYAIANGYVSVVDEDGGPGWCQVLRIVHQVDAGLVESLYAHNHEMFVNEGDWVKRGDKIASIGKCAGRPAHLHLELREEPGLPLGGGYSRDTRGYLDPSEYIKANRP